MLMPRRISKTLVKSAESVTPGHPDKVCDAMADALVDLALTADEKRICRMAAEVTGGHLLAFLTGECKVNMSLTEFEDRARDIIQKIYKKIAWGNLRYVITNMVVQSPDIAQGVNPGGAGDQGCMTGYACNANPEMLPPEFLLARQLSNRLYHVAMKRIVPWAHADGKSQVAMQGNDLVSLVIAIQHEEYVSNEQIYADILEHVFKPCGLDVDHLPERTVINGTGRFVQGSWDADAGTTGRKLVVDNYGPDVPIGGGAYSGKDPTKVDRSAAYMSRFAAKSLVANGLCDEAFVKLSYVIGQAEPTGVEAVGLKNDELVDLSEVVIEKFDLRPLAIIERLDLWRPHYQRVSTEGHYGVDHTNPANAEKLRVWTWENPASL